MSRFKRSSFAAMTSDTKRFLRLRSDTKALINISRPPLDRKCKLKSIYLPVLIAHQKALLNVIGASL